MDFLIGESNLEPTVMVLHHCFSPVSLTTLAFPYLLVYTKCFGKYPNNTANLLGEYEISGCKRLSDVLVMLLMSDM